MEDLTHIIIVWLVVYFIWLLVLHIRNKARLDEIDYLQDELVKVQNYQVTAAQAALNTDKNRRDDINTLYNNQATAAQAALDSVKNNISSALKEATESTKAELVNTHKALITKAAEGQKKEMQNYIVELTDKVKAFEQHTKKYFKVNLEDPLTKAESRIDAIEKKKDELETCIQSELSDLRDFKKIVITTLKRTGISFNKLPDSDVTFDIYVCEMIGTIYKVPKKFNHWKAQLELVQLDEFMAVVYINEDSNEEIEIPMPLLTQIQNPELRESKQEHKETSSIQTSDQETTNLLICPVCEKEFTSIQHTRQHINEIKDEEHRIFRTNNPGYTDQLTAAMEKERYAPRLNTPSNKDPLSTGEAGANIKGTN